MATENVKRLNLGCGNEARSGWVNLDSAALPAVDVVHDLNDIPWPFADGSFDHVECIDIVEHLDDLVASMRELHRIIRPGGTVRIVGPHFTSYTGPTDPTHRRAFAINTFEYFSVDSFHERSYYFDFAFSRVQSRVICFQQRPGMPWNRVAEWVFNQSRSTQGFFEATVLARAFPALNVDVVLVR